MFKYVIHKILNKKWMAASLILGNLLLIGMVSGSLVYSNAVLNRLLVKELNNAMETTGVYPLQAAVEIRMDKTRSDVSVAGKVKELEYLTDSLPSNMQLKAREIIRNYYIRTNYLYEPEEKEVNSQVLDLSFLSGMEDHITFLSGKTYSNQLVDGAIEVIVSRKAMMEQELMLGEELYLADARDKEGNPYKIRITGVFQNAESEDVYWVKSPDAYSKQFFMDEDLFRELFVNYEAPQYKWNSIFYVLMDYSDIKSGQVGNMSSVLERFSEKVIAMDCYSYKEYFGELLKDFQVKEVRLNNILFLLEIPIFILLLVFIYMVNKQMMLNERGDIAMLKSRGASGGHIIRIYLYQGIIFSVLGLLLGIPLGLFFCYSLGNSNAFLEFVSRTALKVDFTGKAFLASLLCGGISLVITLVLAFWHTGETIVSYKRKLNKKSGKPALRSLVAGAVFLSIAGYSLYNFRLHADTLAAGKGLDPLLFCGAIFFILGMAFLVQGLFPFMTEVIFCAGKNHWNPAAYASFQKLNKASDNQGFILLFLILTVSLGIFDATLARTINGNEEDRIVYTTGADLVLQEKWVSNKEDIQAYVAALKAMGQNVDESQFTVVYTEPDFDRYKELEGVEKATKVLMDKGLQVNGNSGKINTALMGIQTKEFGETVNFKDGLLQTHWYNYLNEMGASEDGILVSSNFRDMLGYKTGDTITCSGEEGSLTGIIKGFVDYWPSYAPVTLEKSKDGKASEVNQFLIVANLSKVQKEWGITPYQIWIKTSGSSSFIYDFASQNNLQFEVFKDLSANIIEKNNDPFYQGTNGILTLGFIIILLICAIGFLIFWILSIFTRTLQFGVLRAMGMTLGEIIGMLVQEQLFLSVLPIFFGILIGRLVSGLFVPLIQIAYTSSEQILPLEIMEQGSDRIRVLVIVAAVVLLCMLIIGKLISDMKVTKALKLGED